MTRSTAARLVLGLALAGSGCASHVDQHMGESYETLTAQMVENPDAGLDERQVEGLGAPEASQVTANRRERSTVEYQDRSRIAPVSVLAIEDGN